MFIRIYTHIYVYIHMHTYTNINMYSCWLFSIAMLNYLKVTHQLPVQEPMNMGVHIFLEAHGRAAFLFLRVSPEIISLYGTVAPFLGP